MVCNMRDRGSSVFNTSTTHIAVAPLFNDTELLCSSSSLLAQQSSKATAHEDLNEVPTLTRLYVCTYSLKLIFSSALV